MIVFDVAEDFLKGEYMSTRFIHLGQVNFIRHHVLQY